MKGQTKFPMQLVPNGRKSTLKFSYDLQRKLFSLPGTLPTGSNQTSSASTHSRRTAQFFRFKLTTLRPVTRVRRSQVPPPIKTRRGTAKLSKAVRSAKTSSSSGPLLTQKLSLSRAVARLGAVEERLGYVFNEKSLGLNAMKNAGHDIVIKNNNISLPFIGYRRLALLGDRVLGLLLCRTWYESEQTPGAYALMERRLASRTALAKTSLKVGLEHNVLMKLATQDALAESFEALLGAVYIDSKYNLDKVQTILDNIGFDASDTPIEPSVVPSRALSEQKLETSKLPPRSSGESTKNPVSAGHPSSELSSSVFAADPQIGSTPQALWRVFKRMKRHNVEIYELLNGYRRTCNSTVDLLACFPSLQNRYMSLFDGSSSFAGRLERMSSKRASRSAEIRRETTFAYSVGKPGASEIDQGKIQQAFKKSFSCLANFYLQVTGKDFPGWHEGTLIDVLRGHAGLQPRDAFLTACWLEEQTRDLLRKNAGLPDWYDLPEHRDKVLPPWRVSGRPEETLEGAGTFAEEPGFPFLEKERSQQEQSANEHQDINSSSRAASSAEFGQPQAPSQLTSESSTPGATMQKEQKAAPTDPVADERSKAPLPKDKRRLKTPKARRNNLSSRLRATATRNVQPDQEVQHNTSAPNDSEPSNHAAPTLQMEKEHREQPATQLPGPGNDSPDTQPWHIPSGPPPPNKSNFVSFQRVGILPIRKVASRIETEPALAGSEEAGARSAAEGQRR